MSKLHSQQNAWTIILVEGIADIPGSQTMQTSDCPVLWFLLVASQKISENLCCKAIVFLLFQRALDSGGIQTSTKERLCDINPAVNRDRLNWEALLHPNVGKNLHQKEFLRFGATHHGYLKLRLRTTRPGGILKLMRKFADMAGKAILDINRINYFAYMTSYLYDSSKNCECLILYSNTSTSSSLYKQLPRLKNTANMEKKKQKL